MICRLLEEQICTEANIPSISSINRIIRDKGIRSPQPQVRVLSEQENRFLYVYNLSNATND